VSGIDFTFNQAKGRQRTFGELAGGANDALILVILQSSGLGTDATLKDDDTLAAVLTHATECTASGYSRKTLANVTVTVDDTNDRLNVDCDDVSLGAVGTGGAPQTQAKVVIGYDPDTTGGTDSSIIPIAAFSWDTVLDGSTVSITMPTDGPFYDG
jgi:hypothetical protein